MAANQDVQYQLDENFGLSLIVMSTVNYQVDENVGLGIRITPVAEYQVDENFIQVDSSGSIFLRLIRD